MVSVDQVEEFQEGVGSGGDSKVRPALKMVLHQCSLFTGAAATVDLGDLHRPDTCVSTFILFCLQQLQRKEGEVCHQFQVWDVNRVQRECNKNKNKFEGKDNNNSIMFCKRKIPVNCSSFEE